MKTETQRKPKSIKFTVIYNSLNEQEKNEFRYFVLLNNIEGRNYENVLKLITDNNFVLRDSTSDYKDRTLWNRFSELTILIEKYLAMKEFFEDKDAIKLFQIKQLRKRNLDDLNVSSQNKYMKELNNMLFAPYTLYLKHDLYDEAAFFAAHQNNMEEYRRYKELYEINYFSYVIMNSIIYSFDTLVNEVKGVKINSELTNLIINSVEIKKIIKHITEKDKKIGNQLLMLHGLTLTFNKNENDYLAEAKEIFYKNIKNNSKDFNFLIFKFMLNYCIQKRESGPEKHEDTIVELFEKKITSGCYKDLMDPTPSLNHFRDFIMLAGRKKISLLNLYMKIVFPHVNPAYKPEIEFYVEAIRSFHFDDYERSLSFFNKINKKHYIHYFDYFRFSSMIYFETSRFVELTQGLTNFKTYVNRHNEFSENAKLKIFNFILCLNLLSNYKQSKLKKFSNLEFEIKDKIPILEREWLLKQLDKLR